MLVEYIVGMTEIGIAIYFGFELMKWVGVRDDKSRGIERRHEREI